MSVSAFSVQHDYQVQVYNQMRAAHLAGEKQRKQEEKAVQEASKKDRRMSSQRSTEVEKDNRRIVAKIFRAGRKEKTRHRAIEEFEDRLLLKEESDSDEISLKNALGRGSSLSSF